MGRSLRTGMVALVTMVCVQGSFSAAQGQCMLGEVRWVAFNFAPQGWAIAQGQLLPINQNQAVFSLLGTYYGGDGKTTFALPDLRGRVAVGVGQGAGLTARTVGAKGGAESVSLPPGGAHQHSLVLAAAKAAPVAAAEAGPRQRAATVGPASAPAGLKQTVASMPPFLVLTPIICLQGIFPTRN